MRDFLHLWIVAGAKRNVQFSAKQRAFPVPSGALQIWKFLAEIYFIVDTVLLTSEAPYLHEST